MQLVKCLVRTSIINSSKLQDLFPLPAITSRMAAIRRAMLAKTWESGSGTMLKNKKSRVSKYGRYSGFSPPDFINLEIQDESTWVLNQICSWFSTKLLGILIVFVRSHQSSNQDLFFLIPDLPGAFLASKKQTARDRRWNAQFAPAMNPSQKETIVFQSSIFFGAFAVSFRDGLMSILYHQKKTVEKFWLTKWQNLSQDQIFQSNKNPRYWVVGELHQFLGDGTWWDQPTRRGIPVGARAAKINGKM